MIEKYFLEIRLDGEETITKSFRTKEKAIAEYNKYQIGDDISEKRLEHTIIPDKWFSLPKITLLMSESRD